MDSSRIGLCGMIVLVVIQAVRSQTCEQNGPCACKTAEGWINLEALDSKDPNNPRFKDITSWDGNTYSYNPCSDFTFGGCSNVAACQKADHAYPLGDQNSATFGAGSSGQGVAITYSQTSGGYGVERTTIVTLACDPSAEDPRLDFISEYPIGCYDFTLTTKYACPGTAGPPGGHGGLSRGTILLIIFFVVLILCLVAGILYCTFARNAVGAEKVAKGSFWRKLPGCTADGVKVWIVKIKGTGQNEGGESGTNSGYEKF